MSVSDHLPQPPDAVYVRQRWIPLERAQWAKQCDAILNEYGMVTGSIAYETRTRARYRARALIKLLVDLRLHERWQLAEHTDERAGGWYWTVELNRREGGL